MESSTAVPAVVTHKRPLSSSIVCHDPPIQLRKLETQLPSWTFFEAILDDIPVDLILLLYQYLSRPVCGGNHVGVKSLHKHYGLSVKEIDPSLLCRHYRDSHQFHKNDVKQLSIEKWGSEDRANKIDAWNKQREAHKQALREEFYIRIGEASEKAFEWEAKRYCKFDAPRDAIVRRVLRTKEFQTILTAYPDLKDQVSNHDYVTSNMTVKELHEDIQNRRKTIDLRRRQHPLTDTETIEKQQWRQQYENDPQVRKQLDRIFWYYSSDISDETSLNMKRYIHLIQIYSTENFQRFKAAMHGAEERKVILLHELTKHGFQVSDCPEFCWEFVAGYEPYTLREVVEHFQAIHFLLLTMRNHNVDSDEFRSRLRELFILKTIDRTQMTLDECLETAPRCLHALIRQEWNFCFFTNR